MTIVPTQLKDAFIVEPAVFGDDRGFFFESFNQKVWTEKTGLTMPFVQDNHSRSARGVLRGVHFQLEQPQGKLVRVAVGEVFDAIVDLRRSSPSFGKWEGVHLSAANKRMLWVPSGFGHGFLVLSESADFLYKVTDYYAPQCERTLMWNDPRVGIAWPLAAGTGPTLSKKDQAGLAFEALAVFP